MTSVNINSWRQREPKPWTAPEWDGPEPITEAAAARDLPLLGEDSLGKQWRTHRHTGSELREPACRHRCDE